MRRYLAAILLGSAIGPGAVSAAPAPFGLEIGADCGAVEQYHAQSQGVSAITSGTIYQISGDQIDFEGVQSVTVICDGQQHISAVIASLQKRFRGATFDRLVNILRDDYQLVELNEAHVGNQDARFRDGDVAIVVDEPHMSRTTSLIYKTEAFSQAFAEYQQQQRREQQEQEAGQL